MKRLILIGFMGAGKSAVGRLLAYLLGTGFADTDREIVRRHGPIKDIFAENGEGEFRRLEREILRDVLKGGAGVIATGGGIVLDPENRQLIKESGTVVYLKAPEGELWKRIRGSRGRPLAEGGEKSFRSLFRQREKIYRETADLVFETGGLQVSEVSFGILHECGLPFPPAKVLWVRAGKAGYPLIIAPGCRREAGRYLASLLGRRRVLAVSHPEIKDLYGDGIEESLRGAGHRVDWTLFPSGEENKTLEHAADLYDRAVECGLDRSSVILALGGGVVGDLAGFVAATYMRGVEFVQVPTSLLAQVDASVGGKVAVDHEGGKNLIGAFHQPRLVLADPEVLGSLPRSELANGLAEAVKHGVIEGGPYLEFLEDLKGPLARGELWPMTGLVEGSCRIKAAVVEADEEERSGTRELLNLGHTIGHALETAAGYTGMGHGTAVAAGMLAAFELSRRMGLLRDESLPARIGNLLAGLGVATDLKVPGSTPASLYGLMMRDKKARQGRPLFVLPRRAGEIERGVPVEPDMVGEVLARFC